MSSPALLAAPAAPRRLATGEQPLVPPALLAQLVDGLAAADELWRPLLAHDPEHRTAVRLLATDAYEVWLLGWLPGQSVDRHDHGGSHAAFQVVEGELVELQWHGDDLRRECLATGGRGRVPAGTVHDVMNAGTGPATSLHAYSPPLSSMTFYDPITGERLRTEPVAETAPVLDGRDTGRQLHPARRGS